MIGIILAVTIVGLYVYTRKREKIVLSRHTPSWSPIQILWIDSLPALSMSVETEGISEISWLIEKDVNYKDATTTGCNEHNF